MSFQSEILRFAQDDTAFEGLRFCHVRRRVGENMIEIYGTLGPACAKQETLEEMLRLGMTGMRLNLSHVSLPEAAEQVELLHAAARNTGAAPKLLIDMQGPELRIGRLEKPLVLAAGDFLSLARLGLPSAVEAALEPGQQILLDDGRILLECETADRARVLRGGTLLSRKSAALPGKNIRLPALTQQDRDNLAVAADYGVSGVMQPFVRGREDLEAVRAALPSGLRLFAKIENRDGVEKLDELLGAADEIVIARGDLGNAVPLWELPVVQKRISAACRRRGVPFMVVTQMLYTMEHSPVPTRAEVSDIANAVFDGAASVMVTGETAAGEYPVEVIRYLVNIVHSAESIAE